MNPQRLFDNLDAFAACGATPENGVTRFSWSEADTRARQLFRQLCEQAGLEVETDGAGNMRASLGGHIGAPALVLGSHLDSVRNGGRLDGIYGVCAGLEAIIDIAGANPRHPVQLVAFAEEEGSNYGCTCLGSKLATGIMEPCDLLELVNAEGSAWDKLHKFGLSPEDLPWQKFTAANTLAYLEAHIEQNRILETDGKNIGIVTAIMGMRLCSFTYTGTSDHAASPMQDRRDPMAAFASFASTLETMCKKGELGHNLYCTIGKIECEPNVGIIVPALVKFTVDLRHVDVATLEMAMKRVKELARATAGEYGVDMAFERLSASGGTRMNSKLSGLLREMAESRNARWMDMVSGPAHDAACMATIAPAAMLFVPSIGGLSHCPQESTREADLALGAQILSDAAMALAC